jgi:hypothetical protein
MCVGESASPFAIREVGLRTALSSLTLVARECAETAVCRPHPRHVAAPIAQIEEQSRKGATSTWERGWSLQNLIERSDRHVLAVVPEPRHLAVEGLQIVGNLLKGCPDEGGRESVVPHFAVT